MLCGHFYRVADIFVIFKEKVFIDVEILDASGVHRRNGRFYQEGGET